MTDRFLSLPDSPVFQMQHRCYENFGVESWTKKEVPYSYTNSIGIAKRYADLISRRIEKTTGRVPILELGPGSGKLAFLILTLLKQKLKSREFKRIYFLLLDKACSVVEHHKNHLQLKPFIDEGVLDSKIFDATRDSFNDFIFDNGPMILAHYFFDSIEQILYAKKGGELFLGQICCPDSNQELEKFVIKNKRYRFIPSSEALKLYDQLSDGLIFWPVAGLKLLENLDKVYKNFSLFIADYGHHCLEDMQNETQNCLYKHVSLTYPCNFHALKDYAIQKKWRYLDENPQQNFSIVALEKGSSFKGQILSNHLLMDPMLSFDPHALCVDRIKFEKELGAVAFFKRIEKTLEYLFILDESDVLVKEQLLEMLKTPILNIEGSYLEPAIQIGKDLVLTFEKGADLLRVGLDEKIQKKKYKTIFYANFDQVRLENPEFSKIEEKIERYSDQDLQECIDTISKMELVKPSLITSFFYDLVARGLISLEQYEKTCSFFESKKMLKPDQRVIEPIKKGSQVNEKILRQFINESLHPKGSLHIFLTATKPALNLVEKFVLDVHLSTKQKIYFASDKKILHIEIKHLLLI